MGLGRTSGQDDRKAENNTKGVKNQNSPSPLSVESNSIIYIRIFLIPLLKNIQTFITRLIWEP